MSGPVSLGRRDGPGRRLGPRDGQSILLLVAAMSVLLFGALGLAIDGGQLYAQRQMAQAAADAAAQAGIMSIFDGTNATSPYPFGTGSPPIAASVCTTADLRTPCVYARLNGFGGTSADTVTLSFPDPGTVSGVSLASGNVPAFTVTVQRAVTTSLIRFIPATPTAVTVTAKATSGLVGTVSSNCVYVLSPTGQNAFNASGGVTVTASGCGIAVASSDGTTAATITGGSHVTASAMNVTGAVTVSGGSSLIAPTIDAGGGVAVQGGSYTTGTIQTGTPTVSDPFASLPTPATGSCLKTNYSPGYGTWTLDPGTYCGGITLGSGATITFNPGIYVINGGSLNFGGGATITGSGVMFYLTGTNATYGSVSIGGGASVTFSAQTSGAYMGVLFYQDRTIQSNNVANFGGAQTMHLTGSLYFPTTAMTFSGGQSVVGDNTAIVAYKLTFSGGAHIQYDSTGTLTGLFSKSVALVQ